MIHHVGSNLFDTLLCFKNITAGAVFAFYGQQFFFRAPSRPIVFISDDLRNPHVKHLRPASKEREILQLLFPCEDTILRLVVSTTSTGKAEKIHLAEYPESDDRMPLGHWLIWSRAESALEARPQPVDQAPPSVEMVDDGGAEATGTED